MKFRKFREFCEKYTFSDEFNQKLDKIIEGAVNMEFKDWQDKQEELESFSEKELRILDKVSGILINILTRRIELGISIEDMAEKLGMKAKDYEKIELYNMPLLLEDLIKILDILDLEIEIKKDTKGKELNVDAFYSNEEEYKKFFDD